MDNNVMEIRCPHCNGDGMVEGKEKDIYDNMCPMCNGRGTILISMVEKLVDIINDFFGCDAAYFNVNPFDLAIHLINNGIDIKEDF